ncbi:MAG: GTP-binding protein [Candidatus Sigynarchaeum springense]
MKKPIVHVGLFGHVDSGKTAIARVLSETISTAGLDKHPQSKQRGITIDLGFTSFDLGNVTIALVDAPGHADLIRSAVASANIIDVAIIVIDCTKGFEMQTGEHMVVVEALGVPRFLFALNKIDLLPDQAAIEDTTRRIKTFVAKSGKAFANAPVIPVSAASKQGFELLVGELGKAIQGLSTRRDSGAPFMMPFDHHFIVKGFGTVLTGTILSGSVKIGDTLEISPLGLSGKVKSIHVFKEDVPRAEAGDRAGIAIPGIDNDKLYRGCMLATPGTIAVARHLLVRGKLIPFFKHEIAFHSQVHLAAGMLTVPAEIFPFETKDGVDLAVESVVAGGGEFTAYVHVREPLPCKPGMAVLLSRLDLPPQELRVAAKGAIERILEGPPVLSRLKEKAGRVKDGSKGVVEGLAESIEGATRLVGKRVFYTREKEGKLVVVDGTIVETFGTKGNVRVTFDGGTPPTGTEIKMAYPKVLKYSIT